MGIHQIYLSGLDSGKLYRLTHRCGSSARFRMWCDQIVGITAESESCYLAIYMGAASLRMLEFFNAENPCALSQDKTVPVDIERTARTCRVIIAGCHCSR